MNNRPENSVPPFDCRIDYEGENIDANDLKTIKALADVSTGFVNRYLLNLHRKLGLVLNPSPCSYCKNGVYIEENGKVIPTYIYPHCPKCGRRLEIISNLEGDSDDN